jgi:hypothetical protein
MQTHLKSDRIGGGRLSAFAGLAISIVLHLIIFLLVGSVVIFEGKIPMSFFLGGMEDPGRFEMEEEVVTPFIEEDLVELETNITDSQLVPDETIHTVEMESSADLIVAAAATTTPSFTISSSVGAPKLNMNALVNKSLEKKMRAGPGGDRGVRTLFGFTKAFHGGMEGTLIDLKQDQNGQPTGFDKTQFKGLVEDFAGGKSWDVKRLKDYYQVEQKLYATHVYYPVMAAIAAPEAFGVAGEVEPSLWIIVYQGACTAPKTGSYRFWGFGDDALIARMNGAVVFDGSLYVCRGSESRLVDMETHHYPLGHGKAVSGEWFDVRQGDRMTVEILLGENPGGGFGAFLFIEEKGAKYDQDRSGRPILPLFHTAKTDLKLEKGSEPVFIYEGGLFGE